MTEKRHPDLEAVRGQLLPQLVPDWLVPEELRGERDLAAVRHMGDVAVAFVIDGPGHPVYVDYGLLGRWGVAETDLLAPALANLARTYRPFAHRGQGDRLTLVWDAHDGYDAARLLLTRRLCEAAAQVPGNPVIGVPHRDRLVLFGDRDPDFVVEMAELIDDEFNHHPYPVSAQLYTLCGGVLRLYRPEGRQGPILN
ncbi:DUF1444 family protein [Symbiobacterium terraclitae]|uniref:DUF1444 family protein n=1 Tax=Symbiobacterium terraclitae TaxID=557451 RepID=UPI0035B567C5